METSVPRFHRRACGGAGAAVRPHHFLPGRAKSRAAIIGPDDFTHYIKADRIELRPAG